MNVTLISYAITLNTRSPSKMAPDARGYDLILTFMHFNKVHDGSLYIGVAFKRVRVLSFV